MPKIKSMKRVDKITIWTAMIILIITFAWGFLLEGPGGKLTLVRVPKIFSEEAQIGRKVFLEKCRTCHGKNASGTKQGPPLIHDIYEPQHHADSSFYRAVAKGAKQYHWRYGDMPPILGLSRNDVRKVIRYVREIQKANGIE